jgi:predicted transcriptional regulator
MKACTTFLTETRLILPAETAADLMVGNPISLRAEAKVGEAQGLFLDKGITAAPVIDDSGRPIGVISRSDILVHQVEVEKHRASSPDGNTAPKTTMTVADLMTPAVFAVSEDTPVQRVVSDMLGLHVHRLFVVDRDGTLVGIITAIDVLKHLRTEG